MASNLGHTRVHGEGRRSMPGTRRYLPGRRRPPGPRGPSRGGHERGDKDPAVSLLTATLAAVRVRRVLSEERPPRADGDAKDLGTDEPTASCAAPRGTANNERAGARRAEGRGAASGSMPADGGMLVKAPRSTSAARSSRLAPMRPRWSSRWRDSIGSGRARHRQQQGSRSPWPRCGSGGRGTPACSTAPRSYTSAGNARTWINITNSSP